MSQLNFFKSLPIRKTFCALTISALTIPFFLLLFGLGYQAYSENQDNKIFPPPGELIAVNGQQMHIYCVGEGNPTVIVEQGLGGQSLAWDELNQQMAKITRTCAYDRVGMGYSEPIDQPTLAVDVADNLYTLINSARIEDDIVFVAWSAGGVYAREFYQRYPEKVAGMVLLDSSHEQQSIRMPPPNNQENIDRLNRNYRLSQVGYLRISGYFEHQFRNSSLPKDDVARLIAIYKKSHTYRTLANEGVGFALDLAEGRSPPRLGDIPLVVIAEGKPNNSFMEGHLDIWHDMQRELAALSSNSQFLIAKNSAHAIHQSEPELILEALENVVTAVRNSQDLN